MGGVVRVRLYVWVLGVGMSTLNAKTSLCDEDRGIQVPMTLDHVIRCIRVDHTDFFKWLVVSHRLSCPD
jgi:hypothetical protein